MKTKCFISMSVLALCSPAAWAGPVTVNSSSIDNALIPDNDPNGVSETFNLTGTTIHSITDVRVTLNIADGFNGDFYAYLTHGSQTAILLNRVGLVDSLHNPYGYADAGFNVTLSDNAANGDIHDYQNVSNPNGGVITGLFQPDGRNTTPATATELSLRGALLNVFDGSTADGAWTLFITDASEGGIGTLVSASLQVTGTPSSGGPVPDGGGTLGLLASGVSLLLAAAGRNRRKVA